MSATGGRVIWTCSVSGALAAAVCLVGLIVESRLIAEGQR